jgi:hypothetical protein
MIRDVKVQMTVVVVVISCFHLCSIIVAGHFADALIAQKWTVLSVRRLMTLLGLLCPGIFLLFFSAVNNLALAVMLVIHPYHSWWNFV